MYMAGAWRFEEMEPCKLPQRVEIAFKEATEGLVGMSYTPVLYVASQIVNGMNYCIICKTVMETNPPKEGCKKVVIYQPLDEGKARFIEVSDII